MKLLRKLCALTFVCALNITFADCEHSCYDSCESQSQNSYSVTAEYLYWHPAQAGMTYGLSVENIVAGPLGAKNKEIQQKSDWGSGFRLGIGADRCHSPCDLSLIWTSFHHTAHSSNDDPFILGTQLLGPINPFTLGGSGSGAGDAESNWNLGLDILELDAAYQISSCDCYSFRPYLGIAAVRINQTQKIKYNNFLDTTNAVFFNATIKQKNDFQGIGPKLGIQGDVAVGRGFGIIGNLAASFYYGLAKSPVKSHVSNDPVGFPVPDYAVDYKKLRVIPAFQGQIGITWAALCRKCFDIELAAIYEVQCFLGTWRNQSSQIQNLYIADAGHENLTLNGFTGRLSIRY